ncbi:hypothetical protein Ancab_017517 [Ancistrocladus abbreviatus]
MLEKRAELGGGGKEGSSDSRYLGRDGARRGRAVELQGEQAKEEEENEWESEEREGGGKTRSLCSSSLAPARKPPQLVNHASPAPVQGASGGSMLGGLDATTAQGVAFGTGSAVAHTAVDAVLGPRTIKHEYVASGTVAATPSTTNNLGGADECSNQSKAFQDASQTVLHFTSVCYISS